MQSEDMIYFQSNFHIRLGLALFHSVLEHY